MPDPTRSAPLHAAVPFSCVAANENAATCAILPAPTTRAEADTLSVRRRTGKIVAAMFSWKRGSSRPPTAAAAADRTRSMPIPLKDYQDATQLKNMSGAEQTPPEPAPPAPEFSKARSMKSADSLRRIVGRGAAADAKQPIATSVCSEDGVGAKTDAAAAKRPAETPDEPPAGNTSTEQSPGSSYSWTWSWFRSSAAAPDTAAPDAVQATTASECAADQKPRFNNDNEGGSWAFWAKKTRQDAETGDLAITNTETEHRPRPAEVRAPSAKRLKPTQPSLLVPGFDTLPWQSRFAKLLWSPPPRLMRSTPLRVKKAVVIGVHGYFPARVTRAILGEPTGTSLKFASEAEQMVRGWCATNAPGSDVEIEQIALEGEGRINHRVDSLYALLMNWESLVKQADFVFFAVHSQGAVVALRMVARLISEHKLSPHTQRTAILGMAGSLIGPMPEMDQTIAMKAITRIEHASLLELFELQRPDSELSKDLRKALRTTLTAGVKVILVGSADDQLIPLYSALGVHVQHPNIFRAVYFDGDDVSPTVAAPLLNLALQQMNSGYSDRGVITELSGPLAGALTSKGHSKLYSHDSVYDIGVRVALETPLISGIEPEINTMFRIPKAAANPYVLPWATQALLSEALQNERLTPVVVELLREYDTWRPATKPMKDLKWRLAGLRELVRSKL